MLVRCPYCAAGVPASQSFCPYCGRPLSGAAPGLTNQAAMYTPGPSAPAAMMPAYAASPDVALAPQPATSRRRATQAAQAGREKRHHWIWLGNLITIGIGGWVIYDHWQGTIGLGVALALFTLAALSLGLSRFGARWNRASCLEKLLILPGVLAGLITLAVIALSGSDSDSNQSHSDTGSNHSSSHSQNGDGGGGDGDGLDFGSDDSARRGRQANRLPALICPRCGQIAPASVRFCLRCGQPL
jgi:hypothetical protein